MGRWLAGKLSLLNQKRLLNKLIPGLAVSPLPFDVKREDVESFFIQYGKVNSVRLPKNVSNKNIFCGTALVEFSTDEEAEKLSKQSLSFAGAELEFKPKKDFDAEREKQLECEKTQGQGKRKGSEEASYPKGMVIAFKLKSKSSGDDSKENGAQVDVSEVEVSKTDGDSLADAPKEASKTSENLEDGSEGSKKTASDEGSADKEVKEGSDNEKSSENADTKDGGSADKMEEEKAPEVRPSAASFKDNMDVVIREDLKALFEKFGTVKYIDFKMGEESGYIRFEDPEASQKARAAAVLNEEGGLLVKNYIAILEPVSGDAEKEYWTQIQGNQRSYKGHRGRGGGRFNNRGGGGGRRGRSRDNHSSGRPNKVQKVAT